MRALGFLLIPFLAMPLAWGAGSDLTDPLGRLLAERAKPNVVSPSPYGSGQLDVGDRLREAYHAGYRDGYRDGHRAAAATFLEGLTAKAGPESQVPVEGDP